MAYIYESDVGRLGGNLQTTVAYLLSLHKAEYEWNLLGIKVVGHVDALPIPDGTYEYGDAYTVGTAAPYDMWIYTRADEFHSEAYWFNIGKFPAPGPQGPKGDGLEQIYKIEDGNISSLYYILNKGYALISNAYLYYKDSKTGEYNIQNFKMYSKLPIVPGKYISMDATSDNKKIEVKVDDTALGMDYYKIDKSQTTSTIPYWDGTKAGTIKAASDNVENSIVQRNASGDCNFHKLNFEFIGYKDDTSPSVMYYYDIYNNTKGSDYLIEKTPTNTGTLTTSQLTELQNPNQSKNLRIVYDNQVYYRMDQQGLPNLRYIHLDFGENNKATGKIFKVISTGEWQVFYLDFGGSTRTTHNLTLTYSSDVDTVYLSLTNNRPETYKGDPAGLWAALKNSNIACTIFKNGIYYPGIITTFNNYFKVLYGNDSEVQYAQSSISITDNMV